MTSPKWTNEQKFQAFEWLRLQATAENAPPEAGIAFDEWAELTEEKVIRLSAAIGRPVENELLRREWIAAGGSIHGPDVETVTMPEADYFEFRTTLGAAVEANQRIYIPEGHALVWAADLAELRERAALPVQIEKGEVWYWQGDGHDFPESLVCPVIMQADTLRELIAARQPTAVHSDDIHQIAFEIGGTEEGGYQFTPEELDQFLITVIACQLAGFDRARETPRRQTAVELLLSMGYVWATDHWEMRKAADAGNGGDALPALPPANQEWGPMGDRPIGYNAEQMQDYARAALATRPPVGVEPLGYIDGKDCVFDGGFKCTTPMVWGDPAANRIAVYTAPPAPAAVPVDLERAIDIMWTWQSALGGHVFDGRDVARTLTTPDMESIGVNPDVLIGVAKTTQAVVVAKREIIRALLTTHPQPAAAKDGDA